MLTWGRFNAAVSDYVQRANMTGRRGDNGGGKSRWLRSPSRRAIGEGSPGQNAGLCMRRCLSFRAYFLGADQLRRHVALPVGALPSHRIFPVRNDVGSAVRDDVVVILSIWGKDLGGTGHLGLWNVEQTVCSLARRGNKATRTMRMPRKCRTSGAPSLLSAYSSQISARMTLLRPVPRDWRGRFLWVGYLSTPNYTDHSCSKKALSSLSVLDASGFEDADRICERQSPRQWPIYWRGKEEIKGNCRSLTLTFTWLVADGFCVMWQNRFG